MAALPGQRPDRGGRPVGLFYLPIAPPRQSDSIRQ